MLQNQNKWNLKGNLSDQTEFEENNHGRNQAPQETCWTRRQQEQEGGGAARQLQGHRPGERDVRQVLRQAEVVLRREGARPHGRHHEAGVQFNTLKNVFENCHENHHESPI